MRRGTHPTRTTGSGHVCFSGWNYNGEVREHPERDAFYRGQGLLVRAFCEDRGIERGVME